MDRYNQEKSLLRNAQVRELKVLDKELKKKKGVLREQLEAQREEVVKRHERELHDLAIGHGVEGKPSNASVGISSVDTVAVNASATDNVSTRETYVYPEGNWSSLSKKELEMEAHKRGLGRKGNREELITKLMVFHTDQRRKIEAGELDPNNKPPPSKKSSQTRSFFSALSNFECDNNELAQFRKDSDVNCSKATDTAIVYREDHAKLQASSVRRTEQADVESSGDQSSVNASDAESDNDDIPDSQKVRGSSKQDARGTYRRQHQHTRRGGGATSRGRGRGRGGAARAPEASRGPAELSEKQRRQKREKVMQQVLLKITDKYPSGLPINSIVSELKALKVTNFQPSLLGYDSVEEWIIRQPPSILHYDTQAQKIYPSHSASLPEDEDSSSEDESL